MEQLINGRFEYEVPKLLFSQNSIAVSTKPEENVRGELVIRAEDKSRIKGLVYSSHRRFLLGKERFLGQNVTIPYGADVKGLKPGDSFEGEVVLTTNVGEYRLPFQISIEKEEVKTAMGAIDNLDAFTQLAKEDFREAYHLFVDSSFQTLLKDCQELLPYYFAMTAKPVTLQNLEEFLIGIGKKERVALKIESENLEVYEVMASLKDTLRIHRSTWGHLKAEIFVEGDFLEVEKKKISDDDFIGSVYEMEYIIRRENLGKGKNFGRIRIRTVYEELVYMVVASKSGERQLDLETYAKHKKVELLRNFLDFLLGKTEFPIWKEQTESAFSEAQENGFFTTEYKLVQIYLLHCLNEKEQAGKLLGQLKSEKEVVKNKRLSGICEYLEYVLDDNKEAFETSAKEMQFLEKQYNEGSRSPFLYLQACRLAEKDGALLRRFGGFTRQVMLFAKRHGILSEEMAFRATDLSENLREYSESVYELLEYIYQRYPSAQVVRAICLLIMKGKAGEERYFKWYELAVQKDLKITKLYECYIETMSRNYRGMLPRMIRMYFGYNNTLSDTKKAFVYSNVIRNKKLDKVTYQSYQATMEQFAQDKLKEGRINEDFAVMYREFCLNSKDEVIKRALGKVLFVHRLYCDDPKIRKVIVKHSAFEKEQVYTFNNHAAYLSIYTPDAGIVFEDDCQRRYIQNVDYNLQPLFEQEELARELAKEEHQSAGLLLYTCGELAHENQITLTNLHSFELAAEEESFSKEYRQQIRKRLLLFYQEYMGEESLRASLEKIDFQSFAKINKSLLITILIKQKMYVGAYDLICEYGYEEINFVDLLHLCTCMIQNLDFEYEEELVLLAHDIFEQGIYDEVILKYLVKYFKGPVDKMIEIWQRAMGFSLDAYELEEDILIFSMFGRIWTPQGSAVLKDYVRQRGKEVVILAYVTFESFEFLLAGKESDRFVFRSIEQIRKREWEHDSICDVALLKSYELEQDWDEKRMTNAEAILEECEKKGLKFAFYQNLPRTLLQKSQEEDKVFVECFAGNDAKVTLYYRIRENSQEETPYKEEMLANRYHGIFNKEFLLFCQETLEYYFVIEKGKKEYTTETEELTVSGEKKKETTKYQMINQMLSAKQLGKEEELKDVLETYRQREAWIASLFRLME